MSITRQYPQFLGLKSDPFKLRSKPAGYFSGAGRGVLLQGLGECIRRGNSASIVIGPLGSGKSVLSHELQRHFRDEASVLVVQAGLFMNHAQFLDAVLEQVPVGASSSAVADIVTDLVRYAERQIAPQRLILVIDDAHELAKEVFDLIAQMMAQLRPDSFHVCFLGERQLLGILDRTINLAGARQFEFEPFTTEDFSNYVQHKLVTAGYQGELPVSAAKLSRIGVEAGGIPGAMTGALADLIEEEVAGGTPLPSLGAALLLSSRYWLAAGCLTVVVLLVWLFGDQSAQGAGDLRMSDATDTGASSRQQFTVASRPLSAPATAAEGGVGQSAESLASAPALAAVAPAPSVTSGAQGVIANRTGPPDSIGPSPEAAERDLESLIAELSESSPDVSSAALRLAPEDFTIQLMGSRSEQGVIDFLEGAELPFESGYFETRYQGGPWFVAVTGGFSTREAANAGLASLSPAIRELQPWARPVSQLPSLIKRLR
ncbi:MAG: AAA family ATPase [Pseudomonadota bacterium]|nr:AAA family ATPase [Pseudomonadota bacterium]